MYNIIEQRGQKTNTCFVHYLSNNKKMIKGMYKTSKKCYNYIYNVQGAVE